MEAIVLSGGLGTRLKRVVSDRPKTLAVIGEVPFLHYLFDYLKFSGVLRVILSVGYKKEMIKEIYKDRTQGLALDYCEEEDPLGTGGAIQRSLVRCQSDRVFIFNGDSLFLVSLAGMSRFHEHQKAQMTMAVRRVSETDRFGTVDMDENQRIVRFQEKERGFGFINGGIYCVEKSFLRSFLKRFHPPFSIERDIFPEFLQQDVGFFAYPSDGYFMDIGTPESLKKARRTLPRSFLEGMRRIRISQGDGR